MKKISINGSSRETSAENIAALMEELGFANGTVMVEHNGTALRPSEWNTALSDGDSLELLRIAAGG